MVISCRGESRPPPPLVSPAASGAAAASAAPPRPPSARLLDPRWQAAKGEDPLERARLADSEGALGLLAALDDGGEAAEIALLSLPHADDADLALGPLSERALAAPPGAIAPLLQAILEIAGRPPAQREPLDPEGVRAAGAAVLALARRAELPADVRVLAISCARALAARGVVDPSAIPGDLDP